jgi:hypothetical protein
MGVADALAEVAEGAIDWRGKYTPMVSEGYRKQMLGACTCLKVAISLTKDLIFDNGRFPLGLIGVWHPFDANNYVLQIFIHRGPEISVYLQQMHS